MILWKGGLLAILFLNVNTKSGDATPINTENGPALAMVCGKVTQYRDVSSGQWITGDRDCIDDKQEMLNYCKQVYPTLTITNVIEESEPVHIPSWCHMGSTPPCRGHGHNVRPVKCVEGRYEPKALDVKEGCTFEHKIDYDSCHPPQHWKNIAGQICHDKSKTLSSPEMLKPCDEVDQWKGVQFLCCEAPRAAKPKPSKGKVEPAAIVVDKQSDVNPVCLQPKLIGFCRALLPAWHYNSTSGECEFFHYGGCGGNDNNFQSRDECVSTCQPNKVVPKLDDNSYCGLPPKSGMCLALFTRFYYDPSDGTCKQFVFGGCGGNKNNFYMPEDCMDKCKGFKKTGTNPVVDPPISLPVFQPGPVLLDQNMKPAKAEVMTTAEPSTSASDQFYTDETTIGTEHDVFADKLEAIKSEHQAKVNEILAKWDEDNSEMTPENRRRLSELEEDLQLTISTLEDEYDDKMEALNKYHMGRMDQMVNEERAKTYQKFLDQLQAERPKVRHILTALEKYIEVEKQDKSHIMQHYYMATRDEFDTDSIPDFKHRLNEIDTRVDKTKSTLQEYPDIVERIQDEIDEILSTMPESPDFESDGMDAEDEELEEDVGTTALPTTTELIDGGGIPDPDICLLKPEIGPCRASLPTFYFDTDAQECRIFYYGGCGGNDNNFMTMEECKTACPGPHVEFGDIDTAGVLDSEVILPEEDEFDVGNLDGHVDDNTIQSSLNADDEEDEPEDESILDEDVDKRFNIYGDPIFDVKMNPEALVNNEPDINEASMASNWILWAGLATGLLVIIIAAIAIALKRSQTRPPMRIVVEKPEEESEKELSPEEKQLLALQQNGYENPTYKFFEKQRA